MLVALAPTAQPCAFTRTTASDEKEKPAVEKKEDPAQAGWPPRLSWRLMLRVIWRLHTN